MNRSHPHLNPGLVGHLHRQFGRQLERDEIVAEMFVAAADVGARTGVSLTKFICNAVQRKAGQALALVTIESSLPRVSRRDNDENDESRIENNRGSESIFYDADPLDILIAQECAAEIERRHGSIHLADLNRADGHGITDRGMRKRRAADAARVRHDRDAGQRDMFEKWGEK